jgi:hypothetical protein
MQAQARRLMGAEVHPFLFAVNAQQAPTGIGARPQ